ncbi:hypothetical protein [Pedobacter sp.]|uniref:hypothetical protein n=1 Tax=Pedobacter sp. TaxID=1411316 RepID=UPI00396CFE05
MKRILFFSLFILTVTSCSLTKQGQQIRALEKCEYRIMDATDISLAGTDVKKLINGKAVNPVNLPGLALGLLRKDIPLRAKLNLEITNPTGDLAAINNFEYKILINRQEIANGFVDQSVSIGSNQSVKVPLVLNTNVYQFLTDNKIIDDISSFIAGATNGSEKKGLVTLKIKPSIRIGNELVKYPGFITINKEISSKILL